jgi:hypothetical protein
MLRVWTVCQAAHNGAWSCIVVRFWLTAHACVSAISHITYSVRLHAFSCGCCAVVQCISHAIGCMGGRKARAYLVTIIIINRVRG